MPPDFTLFVSKCWTPNISSSWWMRGSTYKCVLSVVSSRRSRDDNTPIGNLRSSSNLELLTNVVSPEMELICCT
jgi:hypothetical protein